jgi:hypothetical protein
MEYRRLSVGRAGAEFGTAHALDEESKEMGWTTGLEPATTGITIRDSTN